jgi:hypothetical protein
MLLAETEGIWNLLGILIDIFNAEMWQKNFKFLS